MWFIGFTINLIININGVLRCLFFALFIRFCIISRQGFNDIHRLLVKLDDGPPENIRIGSVTVKQNNIGTMGSTKAGDHLVISFLSFDLNEDLLGWRSKFVSTTRRLLVALISAFVTSSSSSTFSSLDSSTEKQIEDPLL